jgi:hypothetical protein
MWYDDNVCEVCGLEKPDVRERECGYSMELTGEVHLEVICDDCEHQHCMDV